MKRRQFIQTAALAGGGLIPHALLRQRTIPKSDRPKIPFGVQTGDVTYDRAIVWSRSDRPARMIVEYATTESFSDSQRISGPAALPDRDFTARVDLVDLPAGQQIFYRVTFQDLSDGKTASEPVSGSFRTASRNRRDLSFVWGGDVCGQGWGINPELGGMKIFEAMRKLNPDFFIHSGDTIYADHLILPEVKLDDGSIWKNVTTPEKSKVAESLDEFRGNYRYNLLDENLRRFNLEVPILAQWDDHETRNNWYPGQNIDNDDRYKVKSLDLLAANAKRAYLEYLPIRINQEDPERIYRAASYGPLLDVLMLDERSYRGPNSVNNQTVASSETMFLGPRQLNWIKEQLAGSKATWKIIASDMPIGVIVPDAGGRFEAFANGNGPALGRELELADLLRFIKQRKIKNVVWLTADVHYSAAHYYDPARARFTDFNPFWEFVAGPLNAGTSRPGKMDDTFGPKVKFTGVPPDLKMLCGPADGLQFFGGVRINGRTEVMTVSLYDLAGKKLFSVDLPPQK